MNGGERFRRYGSARPCLFKYTGRVERNRNVGTCACCTWSVFGVPDKETARAHWNEHVKQVQSGTPPTPRLHQ
jgi:hypothetical protein